MDICVAAVEGVPGLPALKKSSRRAAGMLGRLIHAGIAKSPAGMPTGSEPTPAHASACKAQHQEHFLILRLA